MTDPTPPEAAAPNPNAALLADLGAKAERKARLTETILGPREPSPSHERETEIATTEEDNE